MTSAYVFERSIMGGSVPSSFAVVLILDELPHLSFVPLFLSLFLWLADYDC